MSPKVGWSHKDVQLWFGFKVKHISYDTGIKWKSSAHIRLLARAGKQSDSSLVDPDSISTWLSSHLK